MQKTSYSGFSQASYNSMPDINQSSASLKGKLQTLENLMLEVGDMVEMHRKEFQLLKQLKEELEILLKDKTEQMHKILANELVHLDDETKREIAFQLAENKRIQSQITKLKGDKTSIKIQLDGLQNRIGSLETQVGNHESN